MSKLRQDADAIIQAAITAAQPDEAVRKALEGRDFGSGRVVLVAAGKGAWQMANAASRILGSRIDTGIVITKYDHSKGPIANFTIREAGHPIPDENSFTATQQALDLVSGLTAQDTVLFLLSGGGSALFEKPLIPAADLEELTHNLLVCGADIVEINTLRKRFSGVKGGRFAQLCAPAHVVSIVLSDILGDPLDMIASGPAYPDSSTCAQAKEIVQKYHLPMTEQMLALLEQETPKELENEDFTELLSTEKLPSAGLSFTILLLPVFLILANTLVSQTAFKATIVGEIITFLGNPVIALFISLCLGAFLLAKDLDNKTVVGMMNDALRDAGPIVMITAGGGALGAVVKATGAAGMMANGIVAIGIPGILVPLLIGTIMRFPQGSGTTAMITGSAIIAPMLVTLGINPYLAGLAVCLTAMCPSFLNDSYFHVVTSFSGMDIKTSLKTWTIGSILVPVFGSVIICILSLFIH